MKLVWRSCVCVGIFECYCLFCGMITGMNECEGLLGKYFWISMCAHLWNQASSLKILKSFNICNWHTFIILLKPCTHNSGRCSCTHSNMSHRLWNHVSLQLCASVNGSMCIYETTRLTILWQSAQISSCWWVRMLIQNSIHNVLSYCRLERKLFILYTISCF